MTRNIIREYREIDYAFKEGGMALHSVVVPSSFPPLPWHDATRYPGLETSSTV